MSFSRNLKKIHESQKEHGIPRYTPGIPIGTMEHKGAKEINRMHLGIGLHHEVEVHSVTVSCCLWRISYGNPWVCPLNPLFYDLCMVDFPHPSSSHIYVRLRMLQLEVVNIVNLSKPYNSTAWQDAAALLSSNHLLAMTTSPRCHDKNDDPTMSTNGEIALRCWGAVLLWMLSPATCHRTCGSLAHLLHLAEMALRSELRRSSPSSFLGFNVWSKKVLYSKHWVGFSFVAF